MHTSRACMNDTFGNTLVIEMHDCLTKSEILQKCRSVRIGLERVLIIGKCNALIRGEHGVISTCDLMELAARCEVCVSGWNWAFFTIAFYRLTLIHFCTHIDLLRGYRQFAGYSKGSLFSIA